MTRTIGLGRGHAISGRPALPLSVLLFFFACGGGLLAQSDDYNDGDDTGWAHFNAGTITYNFPDDGLGGKAYRILSVPATNSGPARAFSYRTNVYDDFYAAVDLVAWDNNLDQAFGLVARAANFGAGQPTGYVLDYRPNAQSGGRGRLQIEALAGEQPALLTGANITLEPGHRYRLVMTGIGSTLIGEVYDFSDLTTPLVSLLTDDTAYPGGVPGVFTFSNLGAADVTFDNYAASGTRPEGAGTPHPVPGTPQVVSRMPAAWENFHPYGDGIKFTASTLTTNAINAAGVKLYLNGADVSSGLAYTGTPSNLDVSFNGLTPNTVYDARIVLSDFSNKTSTNAFTFDTFDQAFFDSPGVKVIEAEDYNYNGGQFQDDPPPSGRDVDGFQINGFGVGYYGLVGTPAIDYFDRSTNAGSGAAAEYRLSDRTGTQAGSSSEIDNGGGRNDTIRAKYSTPEFLLPEYEVRGTEGGEWLNYTRTFSNARYHVYLRAACRAAQAVSLDQVTSDPTRSNQVTARLGAFNVPSTATLLNYRYVPLTDTGGNAAALSLDGTNTLRLSLGGAAMNSTQYTLVLNYLLFIPVVTASIALESASDAAGTFALEGSAVIDTAAQTITVPRNGSIRFYRLRSSAGPARAITNVRVTDSSVAMDYQ